MKKMVFGVKPERGLLRHWIFWLCVLFPILGAVGLAWWFGLFNLAFSPTLEGVANFYDQGRFFLAMAALAIPLGATFSRMHSSEQNAELINVSNARREEDKLNDLLGNYLSYLKNYDGKFYGYDDRFSFKEDMIGQPIKVFYYLISYKRSSACLVDESVMLAKAVDVVCARFGTQGSLKLLKEKQRVTVELYDWIEAEVANLGFDFNINACTGEENELLGLFFHDDVTFCEYQNPDLSKHNEALTSMSRCLKFMSACYYYSSQVFFLYDYEYAKKLEDASYKATFLSFYYDKLSHEMRRMISELSRKNGTAKIIFKNEEIIDDEHEVFEVFGDLDSETEDVKGIITSWYRLQ